LSERNIAREHSGENVILIQVIEVLSSRAACESLNNSQPLDIARRICPPVGRHAELGKPILTRLLLRVRSLA